MNRSEEMIGLFATANMVIGHLYEIENRPDGASCGFEIDFGQVGAYYEPQCGPNWWSYYFDPVLKKNAENIPIYAFSKQENFKAAKQRRENMTRGEVAALVKKYIHVNKYIQDEVNLFVSMYFQTSYVIGVHYRGTDKTSEAPYVPFSQVIEAVEKEIPLRGSYMIFVATDESNFLKKMQEHFPNRIISSDAHRTSGKVGVHHLSEFDHYEIGKEAIIDSLLLSRCDLLIRTSSNLSLWSTFFNPTLPVILLNQRYYTHLAEPE